jgi:acyl-CoA dehydrogenase
VAELSLQEFETEARAWLDANATRKEPSDAVQEEFVWGEGPDQIGRSLDHATELAELAEAKAWRRKKYDAGYGWISGPVEYGGRGLTSAHERAFNVAEADYDVPSSGFFSIGLGMVAATTLAHGQEDVKKTVLPALYRADIVGCQLFSEPGAGSDLASLQTRAERDGDEWVVNGQKVWNTGGHFSDIGLLVARTDVDVPKHKGISAFLIDMKAPGVEVRPLRQITGGAEFNEVFFTDARIPDSHRLGDVNDGWRVAMTTLMNERSLGPGQGSGTKALPTSLERLRALVRHFGVADDPVVRQELVKVHIAQEVDNLLGLRLYGNIKGRTPGPDLSMTKLAGARTSTMALEFVANVLGPRITADTGEWGTYAWSLPFLSAVAGHIAGGSDEVMLNILGERVLGLPKDPGIDVTSPFRELKVGTQRS